ncbi:putative fluoride ion transporter CrcB [Gracilaria domingensis]|nr:putative fluoride ion transporter CrcB [Gracilaria domingensis]
MTSDLPLKALGISTAAALGVVLRLAVNRLFGESVGGITSARSALFTDLPANFLGCFILGFHDSLKRRFMYPEWFNVAISTGLAGSVTSPRLPAFVAIPVGLAMAFLGLTLGKDAGDLLVHLSANQGGVNRSLSEESALHSANQRTGTTSRARRMCALLATVFAFFGLYGAMVTGAIFDSTSFSVSHRRFFWMSGVFAPFGALLRWWLSRFNGKGERFPLGTFGANMTAMVLDLSIAVVLLVNRRISVAARFVLLAVISGLGGSLSTVSTWVNEATKLRRGWRYFYVLGTSSAALILGLAIYGTAFWIR